MRLKEDLITADFSGLELGLGLLGLKLGLEEIDRTDVADSSNGRSLCYDLGHVKRFRVASKYFFLCK